MGGGHRTNIFNAIADTLLEQKGKGGTGLNYNTLFRKVKEKMGREISPRDFSSEVKLLVEEKKIQRTEDKDSKLKIKPVFFSVTETTKKEYQQEYLGIDEGKERRRKLLHLLFFYEDSKAGKITYSSEREFDYFLKSVSLSRQDLEVSNSIETGDSSDSVIHYHAVKRIRISKYERKGPPSTVAIRERIEELGISNRDLVSYDVTLPGFTLEEIFQYHKKNTEKLRSALSTPLPSWISPEEHESSVYSPENLPIFSHMEFGFGEIKMAFIEFEKYGLIKQILLSDDKVNLNSDIPNSQKRFIIADEKLRTLSESIWGFYCEKLSRVDLQVHSDKFSIGNGSLLRYLFGDENVNRMTRRRKPDRQSEGYNSNSDNEDSTAEPDKEIQKGFNQINQTKHNMLVHLLIKKHRSLLQRYGLIDLVSMMLFY